MIINLKSHLEKYLISYIKVDLEITENGSENTFTIHFFFV